MTPNQYIITEEQIVRMCPKAEQYCNCPLCTVIREVRSRPYQSERDKVLDKLEQWAWDNRSVFFNNNAYNPLLLKIEELRQKAGEP